MAYTAYSRETDSPYREEWEGALQDLEKVTSKKYRTLYITEWEAMVEAHGYPKPSIKLFAEHIRHCRKKLFYGAFRIRMVLRMLYACRLSRHLPKHVITYLDFEPPEDRDEFIKRIKELYPPSVVAFVCLLTLRGMSAVKARSYNMGDYDTKTKGLGDDMILPPWLANIMDEYIEYSERHQLKDSDPLFYAVRNGKIWRVKGRAMRYSVESYVRASASYQLKYGKRLSSEVSRYRLSGTKGEVEEIRLGRERTRLASVVDVEVGEYIWKPRKYQVGVVLDKVGTNCLVRWKGGKKNIFVWARNIQVAPEEYRKEAKEFAQSLRIEGIGDRD